MLVGLGHGLAQCGLHDDAIATLGEAIRLEPSNTDALAQLGVTLFDADRFEEARDAYGRAAALDPTRADFRFGLGCSLARLGEYRGARRPRAARRLEPTDNLTAIWFGDVLARKGEWPSALEVHRDLLSRIRRTVSRSPA